MSWRLVVLLFFLVVLPAHADTATDLVEADSFKAAFEYGDAIIAYNLILRTQPKNEIRLKLADAAYFGALTARGDARNERLTLAKTTLEIVNVAQPDQPATLGRLARVLAQMAEESTGRTRIELYEQAHNTALQAVSFDAKQAEANAVIGQWHFETAQLRNLAKIVYRDVTHSEPKASLENAEAFLQIAINTDPKCIPYHLLLGKIENALKKTEAARSQWELARTLPIREASDTEARAEARHLLQKLPAPAKATETLQKA